MAILSSANHTIVDVSDNFIAVLTNDSHTLPANSSGTVTSYAGAVTKMNIYRGAELELDTSWTYSIEKSSAIAGFTATIATNGTLTVSAFPASLDSGYVDITATKAGISLTKRLTITKSKQGAAGATARTFFVEPNVNILTKSEAGVYTPSSIVFSSYYKDGTNATKVAYSRYWRIETTTDGINWTTLATQTTLSTTYTVSSIPANIAGLRATTYSTTALTTAVAHDTQSVMVVTDGAKGPKGDKGATGTSVVSVTENYLATTAASGVTHATIGWTTAIQNMTATSRYLWNYEEVNFSDGTSYKNPPVIMGVYGNTGDTGSTGRSITGITEYYLASASASGVSRSTGGWSENMQTTTPTKKYLWNYEKITWSSAPTTTYVEPIIIGVHGDTGTPGVTTYTWVKYADDENGSGISDSSEGKRYMGLAPNKTTATESNNPADYKWSPLYDNVKIGIRNYLMNSDFSRTTISSGKTSKHGDLQAEGWTGYNGGIANPTTSFHAHLDTETFGESVYEFNESDGTRNWKGISDTLPSLDEFSEYSISMDIYATGTGTKVWGGFYYAKKGGTTKSFHSGSFYIYPDEANNWKRYSAQVPLNNDIDFSQGMNFYIYAYGFTTDSIVYMKKPKLEKGTISSEWSLSPEDSTVDLSQKIINSQEAADSYAEAQATLAITTAEAYADGVITAEETARIEDAQRKLQEAKEYAEKVAGEAVGALDLSGYATNEAVENLEINLKKEISSTTGLNMLRNSIGYAGIDYWEHTVANNQVVTAIMNERLRVLGYGSGFYFPPQTGTGFKGIQQTVNVTPGQPYTLSWFLNRATAGAFIVSIYEGTTLKQTIPDGSNVDGEFITEYTVYIPEGNQLTIRFEADAATEALLTGVMLGLGTMPTQWTLANGELYNAYVRIDDNGLVVLRVDENGEIEGFTNMTPEEFAGYYDENRDGTYERIFWFNRDETVTKKLKALDEITMGTIKIVRVEGTFNRGWAFVPIIPEE